MAAAPTGSCSNRRSPLFSVSSCSQHTSFNTSARGEVD